MVTVTAEGEDESGGDLEEAGDLQQEDGSLLAAAHWGA
jgi:hypothetical protein